MTSDQREHPSIVVLGSINMDLVARCATLPLPGQTLTAASFAEIPGGKGANQAVAAGRAGARVSMIGRVGEDAWGDQLVDGLKHDHVEVDSIQRTPGSSGVALITVAEGGENQIVVVPGANGCLTPVDVDRYADLITSADVLLMQLEVPVDCVVRAARIAKDGGTRVILDPAPVPARWSDELLNVDLLCPNETEAAALINEPVKTRVQLESAAKQLHSCGAGAVAITLGADGTLFYDGERVCVVPSFPVDAVDATAAGDAFVGALAVHWAETGSLSEAVRFGNAAGALAASRVGAQPGIPKRSEIQKQYATEPERNQSDD